MDDQGRYHRDRHDEECGQDGGQEEPPATEEVDEFGRFPACDLQEREIHADLQPHRDDDTGQEAQESQEIGEGRFPEDFFQPLEYQRKRQEE